MLISASQHLFQGGTEGSIRSDFGLYKVVLYRNGKGKIEDSN